MNVTVMNTPRPNATEPNVIKPNAIRPNATAIKATAAPIDPTLRMLKQAIDNNQLISLLKNYQLFPQLLREVLIDQAIAAYCCTSEEEQAALQRFLSQHQIVALEAQTTWLAQHKTTLEEVIARLKREIRIEKFKRDYWESQLEAYFLQRKDQLDQVIASIIRVIDRDVALELYFRLAEREQTFAEIAATYSQGAEAQTQGVIGPVELGQLHPDLAEHLRRNRSGQLVEACIAEWYVIAQVQQFIPAQLDESMRQRLLDELFEQWLQQQLEIMKSV